MKKIILFISSVLVVVLVITNCSKDDGAKQNYKVVDVNGVKTFKNSNIPADKNLNIKLKERFTITGAPEDEFDSLRIFTMPTAMATDSKDNIFIIDVRTSKVLKFDKSGKFIKSFNRRGNGPGETALSFEVAIVNDTIFVDDGGNRRMSLYTTEGEFIRFESVYKNLMPVYLKTAFNKNLIAFLERFDTKDGEQYQNYNLSILNKDYSEKNILWKYYEKQDPTKFQMLDVLTAFTATDKNIFVADNSESKYHIDVFNTKGEIDYAIEKHYRKIEFSKQETADVIASVQRMYGQQPAVTGKLYKKAVNNLYFDHKDRLWVASSFERREGDKSLHLDIFKDGVFLNSIQINAIESADFFNPDEMIWLIKGNLLYFLSVTDAYLKVFEIIE